MPDAQAEWLVIVNCQCMCTWGWSAWVMDRWGWRRILLHKQSTLSSLSYCQQFLLQMQWQASPVEGVGGFTDWLKVVQVAWWFALSKMQTPRWSRERSHLTWNSLYCFDSPGAVYLGHPTIIQNCWTKLKNPKKKSQKIIQHSLAMDPFLWRTSAPAKRKQIVSATDVPVWLFCQTPYFNEYKTSWIYACHVFVPVPNCVWYPFSNHVPNVENITHSKEKQRRGEWVN